MDISDGWTTGTISANGIDLQYYRAEDGPPIVTAHTFYANLITETKSTKILKQRNAYFDVMCMGTSNEHSSEKEEIESVEGTEMVDPDEADLSDDAAVIDLTEDSESQTWMDQGSEDTSWATGDYSEEELDEQLTEVKKKLRDRKNQKCESVESQDQLE